MVREGQTYAVPREALIDLLDDILDARQLLERLGGDLRAVAARARKAGA